MTLTDDRLILTDPLEATLRVIGMEDLSKIETIAVEGIFVQRDCGGRHPTNIINRLLSLLQCAAACGCGARMIKKLHNVFADERYFIV